MARPRMFPALRSSIADWKSSSWFRRVQSDGTARGEDHQITQIIIRAYEIADEGDLLGVGIATVGVDARESACLAMHVVARSAGPAQPVRNQRVDDDLVTFSDIGHRRTDRVNPTGILMPNRVGQLDL
jgi:hypothetical protein